MLYLAFLDAWDQPFDPIAHKKNEAFFSIDSNIEEREDGDVITPFFNVTVQNPGIAWIATQPSRYAVISEQLPDDPEPIQLARGRYHNLPVELAGDDCQIEFTCVPPDEDDVLKAAADAIRLGEVDYDPDADQEDREAAEVYDPLFYSPEATDDPSNALAATMDVWRWNRLTLAPERVHLINGTVQHVIAGATAGTHKSARMSIRNPPKALSRIRLISNWTQSASGDQPTEFLGTREIDTYNYQSFIDGLPKPGTAIGSSTGWTIAAAEIKEIEDLLPQTFGRGFASIWGATGQQIKMQAKRLTIGMRAHYEYNQEREEILDLYMSAGVQPVLDDDKTETVDQITLSSLTLDVVTPEWLYEDPETLEVMHYVVGDKVQANGLVWRCTFEHDATERFTANLFDPDTGDVAQTLWVKTAKQAAVDARTSRFFDMPRGKRAVRHGLRRLNRIVQRRARAAEVSFEVEWKVGRTITCADECRIEYRRWPGGELVGKVIGVQLKIDGASRSAIITLGVSIGTGVEPNPSEGIESTNDILYGVTAPGVNAPVDTYSLDNQGPRILVVENEADTQDGFGRNASESGGDPVAAIAANPTILRIYFEPLRQEDLITRRISAHTQPVYVRKGIDLSPEIS
ncbi:hypothetical protein [Neorhizobium galegae]|uniref:Uncharacterized protein n=1 Tax=Neorhizobium galegae bv. orientalis str. HAMBI 540 TaxID=1028800 RepID=A0A068SM47_NEOGA|nr:hypothetical protein [Neorhizobium galegae]CDN46826.1 Hypothetical protein RG540_CH06360 [Neorhizobium galegae bv. orientalis str. HAMBI 540]